MAKASAASTIDPSEARHFGALASAWWDPKGSSAMLHKLNPVRLRFLRDAVDAHWRLNTQSLTPLQGKTALDVGCGAGLMCEPLARLGAQVTGVDAAPENIFAATEHAKRQNLPIKYVCQDIAQMPGQFDLVTSMEVIEHVPDTALFLKSLAARVAPGGLLLMSTPNRTPLSKLAMISLGEGLNKIPRGTHDWNKFLTPEELTDLVTAAGFQVIQTRGLAYSLSKGFSLSENLSVNYLIAAVAA
jgi:2-polyprenyl-6-hydroxyphenyl methylase / 3-demethylubiquinone-9 3-methyltransferase